MQQRHQRIIHSPTRVSSTEIKELPLVLSYGTGRGSINEQQSMNEWIYVLTVEALVFGLLGTLVTAQRLDV